MLKAALYYGVSLTRANVSNRSLTVTTKSSYFENSRWHARNIKLQFNLHRSFCYFRFGHIVDFKFLISGKELTQLDVSQNQLQNVPSNAIKNLHHLLILNLNHNRISQIHNRAFEGLDTLEILTLYENKINVVEAEAFRGLEKWV